MSLSRRSLLTGLAATSSGFLLPWPSPAALPTRTSPSKVIATTAGNVRGRQANGACAYRGIPYGASTAGAARFQPPAAPSPWAGVRELEDCGPPCPQINTDLPAWIDPRPASEACLVLNVWTPDNAAQRRLPVMVWIHGGAYLSGSGGLAIYDGAALARHGDVVVVTVNHRLSALGYLYLGDFDARYADSGNVGQLDLVAALEWVRDNITGFGGDPRNVTIFGESGGGGKVTALMSMPRAQPLFHKAIVQSGSLRTMNTRTEATEVARVTLEVLGLTPKDLDRLIAVPPDQIVQAADTAWKRLRRTLAFRPVIDGRALPEQDWEPNAPAQARGVPMLIGTNRDEAAYFIADPEREPADDAELATRIVAADFAGRLTVAQARTLIDGYRRLAPRESRLGLLIAVATDVLMWRDAVTQADRKTLQGGAPVFMYEFAWRTPCFGRSWAPHGSEIPMVFGNLYYEQAWDSEDTPAVRAAADPTNLRAQLADRMMRAWAAFARHGDPSITGLPSWPRYRVEHRATLVFDAKCRIERKPRAARRDLLQDVMGDIRA